MGNAIKRNRAKRLLRAHFLTVIDSLPSGQYVFVAKAPLLKENFSLLAKAFTHALTRADALPRQADR